MKHVLFILSLVCISTSSALFSLSAQEEGLDLAPDSLFGLEVEIHEHELMSNGAYEDLGLEEVQFGSNEVGAFDGDTQQIEYEAYIYEKTSPTTAQ